MNEENTIKSLKEALSFSPNNIPLRKHLAESLLNLGKKDEAETEYRAALKLAPNDIDIKLGLAKTFYSQLKNKEAMVLIEEVCQSPKADGTSFILFSKLLRAERNIEGAINAYKTAIEKDIDLVDEEFELEFGIDEEDQDSEIIDGKIRIVNSDEGNFSSLELERPSISFKDVGGMEDLKELIRLQIVHPLKNSELYKAFGKTAGGGILLYGPPGCGKTYIARAVAGEIKANFLSVGIQDVLDMWIGSSESKLHNLFETARRNKPCVMFFDEVDALAASRSDMRQSAGKQVINQFLAEMDGINSNNSEVLILAATNAPWHIDTAFRRPGRFERVIFVPPPDAVARNEIYKIKLGGKPVNKIDIPQLSKVSCEFSGADIDAVINIAVESKLQTSIKAGHIVPLEAKDLVNAIKRYKPTTKEWFLTAKNHALYSNQGGVYDDVLEYMKIKKL